MLSLVKEFHSWKFKSVSRLDPKIMGKGVQPCLQPVPDGALKEFNFCFKKETFFERPLEKIFEFVGNDAIYFIYIFN